MTRRIALALALLAAFPASAQTVPPPASAPAAPAATTDLVTVALDTAAGRIVLALDRAHAPATTANFLRYVDSKRFDGSTFYRAMPYGAGNGLIQAGITKDARLLYPPVAHEPPSQTGLKMDAGAVAMANLGPGTAKSDFFILAGPITTFGDAFAVFGHVVEGMDVVKAILASPVSPDKGIGPMKGQMLDPAVTIRTARRVAN
ncbi:MULTISPECIES: peptidylprolyl isomerase [Sphingomonas]|uniref:peptidylprolyl isomerase n=1 Tax=Sphingomonas TaxID=13687 RepID=UPI000DEFA1DB|nr:MULTISPECIES: peptidylprolyl isomerase [Sphingomonas]